jgi:hypothetical protein
MAKIRLDPFDKDRDFEVARDQILWRGEALQKGDPFPKQTASKRSLRLLYETRAITYSKKKAAPRPDAPARPALAGSAPQEDKLSLAQKHSGNVLRKMADQLGINYAPRATKATLAEMIIKARNVAPPV